MIDNNHTDLLDAQTPQELQSRLLVTSIILSSYEIIKSMVVQRTKFTYLISFGYGGDKYADEYATEVLARHKSPLIASAKYLCEHYEAISSDDVDQIIELRALRNNIAHELPTVLISHNFDELTDVVKRAREILFKLDNFWLYIEIGHDPEHSNTDWDTAYSNSTMFIDQLIDLTKGHVEQNG